MCSTLLKLARVGPIGMVPLDSREVDTFHRGPTLLLKESGTDLTEVRAGSEWCRLSAGSRAHFVVDEIPLVSGSEITNFI